MKVQYLERTFFSVLQVQKRQIIFMENMSDESKQETPPASRFSESQVNAFLKTIGLIQPIDYIFMDYAMTQNRKLIANSKEPLYFLFHVIMGAEGEDRPFPYCSFLELVNQRSHMRVSDAVESDFKTLERYIIYNFCPSNEWKTRPIAPFTDFHLYFLDVLKPMVNQSAEELYQILDIKRGETFFLMFGNHEVNEFMSVLFVMKTQIVVFHIMKPTLDESEYSYLCKWISQSVPTVSRSQHEYAIFELPDKNLVLNEEGVAQRRIHWKEAFGDPDLMDQVGPSDLTSGILAYEQEEECLGCGS